MIRASRADRGSWRSATLIIRNRTGVSSSKLFVRMIDTGGIIGCNSIKVRQAIIKTWTAVHVDSVKTIIETVRQSTFRWCRNSNYSARFLPKYISTVVMIKIIYTTRTLHTKGSCFPGDPKARSTPQSEYKASSFFLCSIQKTVSRFPGRKKKADVSDRTSICISYYRLSPPSRLTVSVSRTTPCSSRSIYGGNKKMNKISGIVGRVEAPSYSFPAEPRFTDFHPPVAVPTPPFHYPIPSSPWVS